MTDKDGGFYSAEDADSVIDPAKPEEKGEGAFYIWKQEEIVQIAGQPAAGSLTGTASSRTENVANDPQEEFKGKNILFEAHTVEETARHFDKPADEVRAALAEGCPKSCWRRVSKRVRPHLDDKVLSAWNGLMISAFAKGGAILDEPRYSVAAARAAHFILGRMYDPKNRDAA